MEQVKNSFGTYGKHMIADLWGCDFDLINDLQYMKSLCELAARATNASVVNVMYKEFDPQGLTVLVLLEESHLSIHTYPEYGFIAFDCYTCSDVCYPEQGLEIFKKILEPEEVKQNYLERGIRDNIDKIIKK